MTFFSDTKIESWQSKEAAKLRLAFRESLKRATVSRGDKNLLEWDLRSGLLAVSRHSRVLWGETVCEQLSRFFCEGGDGTEHKGEIYFVTLTDISCARSPAEELSEAELQAMKN